MTDDNFISKQNIRIQKIVTFVAVLLFGIKFYAWQLTHSLAIYTDMLESIVNITSAVVGLYTLYFSAQPRDENHPYGHGKAEFISAAAEGAFIVLAGVTIIIKIFTNLGQTADLHQLDFGIVLILLTALINYGMGYVSVRIGKNNNSLALIASGKHLQTDTWSTVGIIIGLIALALTGQAWLDRAVAFVFAMIIILSGLKILRSAFAGILDAADPELIKDVVAYLNEHRRPNWIDLHNLRIIKYGRILHFDAHMTVPWQLNVREAHMEQEILSELIRQKYGQNVELFIHLDPNLEDTLPPQEIWTVEKVLKNKKHILQ